MRLSLLYLTLFFSFLLGSQDGFIALWVSGQSTPVRVFPYSVASLPPADQERLRAGITLDSEDALRQLLEDYLS